MRVSAVVVLFCLLAAGCGDDEPAEFGVHSETTTTTLSNTSTSTKTPSVPTTEGADAAPAEIAPGPSIAEEGLFVANYLPPGMELISHAQGNRGSLARYSLSDDSEPDPALAGCGQSLVLVSPLDRSVEEFLPRGRAYDEIEIGDRVIYRMEGLAPRTTFLWGLEDGRSLQVEGMGVSDNALIRIGESVRPVAEQIDIAPSDAPPYTGISLKDLTYGPNFTVSGRFTATAPRSIEVLGSGPAIRDVVEFDIDEKLFTDNTAKPYGTDDADIIEVVVPSEVTSALLANQQTRWVLVLTGVGTDGGPMGAPACGIAGILEFIDGNTLRSLYASLGEVELAAFIQHLESLPS